ncbi:hypothetical protein ACMFMG_010713 [Clarireedia jacksonii]
MSPSSDTAAPAPKIAVKGFSLKAGSTKSNGKPQPPSNLGKRPRSTFAHDDESDDSDDGRGRKHEVVTGFADGGVIRKEDERKIDSGPLVIPKLGNRDWRGEARERLGGRGKGKNLLPEEEQRRRAAEASAHVGNGAEGVDVVNGNDGEIKWGLSVKTKVKEEVVENGEKIEEVVAEEQVIKEEEKPKTEDELALEALMGGDSKRKGPDLIIESANGNVNGLVTEEDAYRKAIASAPDVSTLEDYERVPVEEFGAALLRGMGWDGKERKSGGKEVKRRQNLLGLGAKELKDAEELGAWVQKSDAKRLRPGNSSHRGGDRDKKRMGDYARERDERSHRRDRDEGRDRDRDRVRDHERDRDRDRGYRRDRDDYRDRRR